MDKFYKNVKKIVSFIVKLFFKVEIEGSFETDKNYILCCNHQSLWDVFFLVAYCPKQVCFMGKKELFSNKIIAKFLRKMGAFPVNRASGDVLAFKTALKVINSSKVLGIFPEGTRNPVGRPGSSKAGVAMLAIKTQSNVQPVAIRYKKRAILFSNVEINIGEMIVFDDFGIELQKSTKSDIRKVLKSIMDKIIYLWEN